MTDSAENVAGPWRYERLDGPVSKAQRPVLLRRSRGGTKLVRAVGQVRSQPVEGDSG